MTGLKRTVPQMMSLSPTVTISGLLESFQRQMNPSGDGACSAFHIHIARSTWEHQRACRCFSTGMIICTEQNTSELWHHTLWDHELHSVNAKQAATCSVPKAQYGRCYNLDLCNTHRADSISWCLRLDVGRWHPIDVITRRPPFASHPTELTYMQGWSVGWSSVMTQKAATT